MNVEPQAALRYDIAVCIFCSICRPHSAIFNFIPSIQHFYSLVKAPTTLISPYTRHLHAASEWTAAHFDNGS